MLDVSIWGAFIGGLIVFFSPCVLPIVPFYISYMAGAGLAGLKEDGVIPSDIRRKALISSLFFSLGIITVFVLLGAAAFSISQAFRSFQNEFRWVAGAVIFLMGFHFLGILRIGFLDRQFQVNAGDTSKMDAVGSYLVGLAFAAGWTPCVGPILGSILPLAATTPGDAFNLLLAYSAGIGIPFIIMGIFITQANSFVKKISRHLKYYTVILGSLIIILGILVFFNQLAIIASFPLLNNLIIDV